MKQNSVFMVANKKNIFAYLWYNFCNGKRNTNNFDFAYFIWELHI